MIEYDNTVAKSVCRLTKTGLETYIRPAELSDKCLVREFLDTLSVQSLYRRFLSLRKNIRDEFLGDFFIFRNNQMKLLVLSDNRNNSIITGIGQCFLHSSGCWGEIALVVSDINQNKGIGRTLLSYMAEVARGIGLKGFEGIVQIDNCPMLHLCRTVGFRKLENIFRTGVYEVKMYF
ncbi:MAG TPA: GNAT family N-acetyltransferase [Spirochaetia bacterium]|nr:GNAT family N-acetyltransferase [Spirochaetia bacterium]